MLKKVIAVLIAASVSLAAAGCAGNSDSSAPSPSKSSQAAEKADASKVELPESYQIQDVHPIFQNELKAGCETYAATMLLQILGFNVDEFTIADNYLDIHYISFGEGDTKYGPDMHSAFAGSPYAGWGVYAPSMAKSMTNYLKDQKSKMKAYAYKDIPLETLIKDYTVKGVPVMIWATTDMEEPYVFDSWIVDYVDENAEAKLGDTVDWYMHEHCLVLIGYDKEKYYFADSTHGNISSFEKSLVQKRYEQMGTQCIVVK